MDSSESPVFSLFQTDLLAQQESLPEITANRIREMIYNRKLLPGARLPNEVELAEVMGVSRGTMRTALNILQEQGLIWRRQGVGSFVSEQPILEQRLDINRGDRIDPVDLLRTKVRDKDYPADENQRPGSIYNRAALCFIRRPYS
jgi:DNA-binding transcriptional MocR family regulator